MEFNKSDFLQKIKNIGKKDEPSKSEEIKSTVSHNEFDEDFGGEKISDMFYRVAPIDVDEDNLIVGEKTGTTMNAEVMMERQGDANGKVSRDEELPEYSTEIFSAPLPVEEDVQFRTEIPEGAKVAEDIIDNVPQLDRKSVV